jgi:hypothetical protein
MLEPPLFRWSAQHRRRSRLLLLPEPLWQGPERRREEARLAVHQAAVAELGLPGEELEQVADPVLRRVPVADQVRARERHLLRRHPRHPPYRQWPKRSARG